jgi:hypothetical protein
MQKNIFLLTIAISAEMGLKTPPFCQNGNFGLFHPQIAIFTTKKLLWVNAPSPVSLSGGLWRLRGHTEGLDYRQRFKVFGLYS